MGKKKIAPRAVFDTNVVVSTLLFASGQLAWLRQSWRAGAVIPLLSEASVRELMTVLACPKFHLAPGDIEALLADYLPYGQSIHPAAAQAGDPRCRDQHDQLFVDLAVAGTADWLVTGDKDLLVLDGQLPRAVVTPASLREILDSE